MSTPPSVNIARLIYVLICEAAGLILALSTRGFEGLEIPVWAGLVGGLLVAGFFILVESMSTGFSLRGFSTATFGILVGLFCAFLLTRVGLSEVLAAGLNRQIEMDAGPISGPDLAETLSLATSSMLYASFGFLGAVLALRSNHDDFAFILPYVRFREDGSSGQPVILDAEAIMDGRVPGIMRAGFLTGRLIVPRFVLDELQALAESGIALESQRAKRGLDLLEKLREQQDLKLSIEDIRGISVAENLNSRILQTAQLLGARVLTVDENFTRVAKLRGVDVLNLHDLLDALKPEVTVGEKIRLALVRPGKDENQAVGYLGDGTMIVVNDAAGQIGSTVDLLVVSTLQTAGGTMVFAEISN